MKNLKWITIATAILAGLAAMGAKAITGGQSEQKFDKTISRKVACEYLLHLPVGYEKKGNTWPLIVFLHGAGERGDNLEMVKKHGPPKLIELGRDFPFIVVSPQCPNDLWWPQQVDMLSALLDDIEKRYRVDRDREYLTGLSMGGFGTWSWACAEPNRFAAIAPICGGGERYLAPRLKKTPTWVFHGAKDEVVPLARSEEMATALKKAGGDVKLTVYPDATHDSWSVTYDNPELYEWFLKHKRSDKTK
jgi:predicted peptidase